MNRRLKDQSATWPAMRAAQVVMFIMACLLFSFGWYADPSSAFSTPTAAFDPPASSVAQDRSKFVHSNPTHQRMPCLLCHTRNDNSARVGFPGRAGHAPCAGCHAVDFAGNTSPMCTICHTDTGMKKFPGLKTFSARFDHGRHQRVNCSVCHKPASRGVAYSIPSDAGAHTTCFECHTASSAQTMSSCNVCHQPGKPNWTSEWARSFKINFSHARHTRGTGMSCASCHTLRAGEPRGRQVTEPQPSMHFAPAGSLSCGGCHNGTKAFGANEFSNCKRCHTGNGFRF